MKANVEKIFATYKKISKREQSRITTSQLNVLYNIYKRAERDEEYAAELKAYDTGLGDDILRLIDKFFDAYNTRYGLDIRDSLIVFDDPEFTEGSYFLLTTYAKGEGGSLEERSPLEFKVGEVAHVKATLYSHSTDKPMGSYCLAMSLINDCGGTDELTVYDADTIEFDATLQRAGAVRFNIEPRDENGKVKVGAEIACGGILFSKDEILPFHSSPEDFDDFWRELIGGLMRVDPKSTEPDGYEGDVVSEFDMPKKNFFGLRKFDEDYLDSFARAGYAEQDKSTLETHDSYEVYLKAPGPCHASGFLSIPKNAKKKSLPLTLTFDGYSAYAPMPVYSSNEIRMHSTHHGYEMAKPREGYYLKLSRGGILANYGRASGDVNSGYANIRDCYMTYLHLRNLQMLRFATDPALSGDIPLLHEYWNGEIKLIGGSMGGYQASFTAALATLLLEVSAPFKIIYVGASVPAFCNLAGRLDGRIATRLTMYEDGMDYFDPAMAAHLVNCPFEVQRAALGDESCPATHITAFFNSLPKHIPKKIKYLQNSSHGYIPDEYIQDWHCYKYNMDGKDFCEMVF